MGKTPGSIPGKESQGVVLIRIENYGNLLSDTPRLHLFRRFDGFDGCNHQEGMGQPTKVGSCINLNGYKQ